MIHVIAVVTIETEHLKSSLECLCHADALDNLEYRMKDTGEAVCFITDASPSERSGRLLIHTPQR